MSDRLSWLTAPAAVPEPVEKRRVGSVDGWGDTA